ncbi:kelch protein 28 [Biomphalaria glabrata]|nr:kelch protein 28 [Biomphalaria glabrata]
MVIKREVAHGIVQGLSDFWKCEELQDFTVILTRTKFGCHKFLLAACSGFFRGLFRSGMKETELNCVTLEDISSETFDLILETLYTGHGVLTKENVIDIWRAAHQLQIIFLITECENFVIKSLSLENYIDYFQTSRFLNSETVSKTVWSFILKNANSFFTTTFFLELPLSDVLNLVKSQHLEVNSENDVIKAILKWTECKSNLENQGELNHDYRRLSDLTLVSLKKNYTDDINNSSEISQGSLQVETAINEIDVAKPNTPDTETRSDKTLSRFHKQNFSASKETNLGILISHVRTCLATHDCLEMLMSQPLVRENRVAHDIVTQALFYQLQIGKRNGQWPTAAIHRNNSAFENIALTTVRTDDDGKQLQVFSFSRKKWLNTKIKHLNNRDYKDFCVIDNSLFYFFLTKEQNENEDVGLMSVLKLTGNDWSKVNVSLSLSYSKFYVAAVNECIYIIQSKKKKIWRLQPTSGSVVCKTDLPDDQPICHVTCYENFILGMISNSVEGVDETQVYCYDTLQDTWSRLNNLEGPAKGMTSFKDDQSTYLLQSNGDVWKIVKSQSDVVDFEHVVKLWSCDWPLHGAVTFMDKLYIYGVKSETREDDPQLRTFLKGWFKKIIHMESESTDSSTFIPIILSRKCLA